MLPWTALTSLGDIKAMAPVAATIALGLVLGRAWRMALWWCLLLAASLGLVIASKIAFIGWCVGSSALDFTGFSGHAMRTTAIVPVLFYLLLQNASATIRALGVLLGIMFGVAVGVSRLVLRNHSISEVVAGCILGIMVSVAFIFMFSSSRKFVLNRLLLGLCLIIFVVVPYTEPAPTQRWMVAISLYLSGHDAPCDRSGWKTSAHNPQNVIFTGAAK